MSSKSIDLQLLEYYNNLEKQKGKKDRIYTKIKLNQKLYCIERFIDSLKVIAEDTSKDNYLRKLLEELKVYIVQIEENIAELDSPFSLFIVGMGKHGKSTLLNALLGSAIVEMDTEPKTWKIDIFYGSDEKVVKVFYKDGSMVEMTSQEAKKLLEEEEQKREESLDKIEDEFYAKKKELKTIEEKKEYKQYLTDLYLYISPIVEVRWPMDKNDLLNSFRLVDTPGLKQNLPGNLKKSLEDYYHKADGVLWLLDATKISGAMSKELMEELQQSLKDIGGNTDNVVAVLNYIDKIRKQHGEETVKRTVEEANKVYGIMFNNIIPISAKEALEGKINKDEKLLEVSGYNKLMELIRKSFLYKSNDMQIKSKLQGIKSIKYLMNRSIEEYERLLKEENKKRIKLKDNFEEDIELKKYRIKNNIEAMIDKYKRDVEKNIPIYLEGLFEDSSNKQEVIRNKIFKLDNFLKRNEEELHKAMKELQQCNIYHVNVSRFKKYKYIETHLENYSGINKNDINLPQFYYDDFSTTVDNELFSFLNNFEFTGKIMKMYKSYKIKNKLLDTLESITYKVRNCNLDEVNLYVKNIEKNVENVREESFKVYYCSSDTIKNQLRTIEALTKELTSEIHHNNIYEYITGEVKTGGNI